MSNNTTIILLWFDWSNIKQFKPIRPRLSSIKMHFDSVMTLLICFWPQVGQFTLQTPIPVQGEKKRQDLTATAPREQPKLQASTPEIDWLCLSWLKHEAVVTQTLHFGCPCSLLSIPLHLPHTLTDTRLVYYINARRFTSCQRQNDSSEECDKVGAGLTV